MKIVAVLIAGEPDLDPLRTMNAWIPPVDVPAGSQGTAGPRAGLVRRLTIESDHGEPGHRESAAAPSGERRTRPPGRNTSAAGFEMLALASTTAI